MASAEWRETNRAEYNEYQRLYYYKVKEKVAIQHREYRAKNKERIALQNHSYRLANKDRIAAQEKAYKKAHRDIYNQAKRKRRVVLAGGPATLTRSEWEAIKAAYGFRCAYCGRRGSLSQDHVIPINVVPACVQCNRVKGARAPMSPVKLVLL